MDILKPTIADAEAAGAALEASALADVKMAIDYAVARLAGWTITITLAPPK